MIFLYTKGNKRKEKKRKICKKSEMNSMHSNANLFLYDEMNCIRHVSDYGKEQEKKKLFEKRRKSFHFGFN